MDSRAESLEPVEAQPGLGRLAGPITEGASSGRPPEWLRLRAVKTRLNEIEYNQTVENAQLRGTTRATRCSHEKFTEWAGTPMSAEEYRSKAAACLLAAESLEGSDVRARWLAMAQAWNRLADEAERKQLTDLFLSKGSAHPPSDQP